MRIVCLIPARLKSQRLNEKPIADIAGLPMFAHAYFRAKLTNIEEIYVCTDSEKIENTAKNYNIKTILTKPTHKNGTERVSEGASILNLDQDDIIVNLHGDEPFINPEDLNKMASYFVGNEKIDILIPYVKTKEKSNDLNTVKLAVNHENKVLYLSRSKIPSNYKKDYEILKQCGVSIYKHSFLRKYLEYKISKNEEYENIEIMRAIDNGNNVYGFELKNYFYSVDVEKDLQKANQDMENDLVFNKYKNDYTRNS